jgi:hypothetical protein
MSRQGRPPIPGAVVQPPGAVFPPSAPPAGARPVVPAAVSPVPVAPKPVPVPVPVAPKPVPVSAAPRPIPAPAAMPMGARPIPIPLKPIPVKPKGDGPVVDEEAVEEQEPELITPLTASPWLISMIVHIVLVLVLAFIFLAPKMDNTVQLEMIYAEDLGEQLETDILDMGLQDPETTDAALAFDSKMVDDPLAAPPIINDISPDSVGITSDITAPSIGLALSGREAGAKKALLGAYGGTATTEAAVKLGLDWLVKQQKSDGTWSLLGPYGNGGTAENVTSATAMALLAFQGHGDTPHKGEYKKVVEKGWKALLAMQDRDGNFVRDGGFNQRLYAQAQATIAICELYGMTKDSKYAEPAERAVQFALKAQSPEGGWRYQPGVDSDTSVTGWFVMALQSARMAKMEVPQSALDNVTKFLDYVSTQDGTRYSYQRGREADAVMTAEAMLCRQYLGWKRSDERLASGADYVLVHPLSYSPESQNVYYWYYATQFMHHMEGAYWNKWNSVMRQAVPSQQVKSGAEKGSWSPTNDEWGSRGAGRLYVTCLSIYMLEVYYRHLPLYSGDATRLK